MTDAPIFKNKKHPLAVVAHALLDREGAEYGGSIRQSTGGRFTCPVHHDERPSLDIQPGRSVAVIANCKVCESVYTPYEFMAELTKAIDVPQAVFSKKPTDTEVDWGKPAQSTQRGVRKNGKKFHYVVKHKYVYRDPNGNPKVRIVRKEDDEHTGPGKPDKDFFGQHMVDGEWLPGIGANERTPWLLERFREWKDTGLPIYLVEGEETVKALVRAGHQATTFYGGATGRLEAEWVQRWFTGWPEVIVWADRDVPGVARARELIRMLKKAGVKCRAVVSATENRKDDAVEHLAAGLDVTEAVTLTKQVAQEISGEAPEGEEPPEGPVIQLADFWPPKSDFDALADRLIQSIAIEGESPLVRWQDEWWMWSQRDNVYKRREDRRIKNLIRETLRDKPVLSEDGIIGYIKVTKRIIAEVEDALMLRYRNNDEPPDGEDMMSFRNGHLRVDDRAWLPKSPTLFNISALPFEWDTKRTAKAHPVEWFKFLDSCGFTDDTVERRQLQQWFGYVLSGSNAEQKIALIVGHTRSGKGVLTRVLQNCVGKREFIGVKLRDFSTEFGLEPTVGKKLIAVADARFGLNSESMSSVIERMLNISGNDSTTVNRKNKSHFEGTMRARVMVTTNVVPRFVESSDALVNRFIIIEMRKSWLGHEDKMLEKRLEPEYPEIIRWALEGLDDLLATGKFATSENEDEIRHDMLRMGNNVRAFLEDHVTENANGVIPTQTLYSQYKQWCRDKGEFQVSDPVFAKDLRQVFPDARPVRVGGKRDRRMAYRGIEFNE